MAERQQRQRLRALQNNPQLARFIQEGRATGKQLGTGSYGSVEEVEVNGLICAGKKIHDLLIDAGNVGVETVAGKYVQECQLMSDLRHPNITLFLGVCFLPDCQLPVLLMERLDGNLDNLIETVPNIPLALKRSILEDVSRGLLYLHKHTPQIIHRDLTTMNVLLTSYFVAKITDLGNSRIVNLQPGQLARTLSRVPGTQVYMPPEALSSSSRYGPSLDIFSFGHLALFTLTQVFPGDLLEPNYPDPNNPRQLLARSEVDRRGTYFERLERVLHRESAGYRLVGVVKQCLENIPEERPTAEQLVRVLEGMKGDIEGTCGKLATADAARQVMTALALKRKEKEKVDELTAKEEEIQQLQQQLEAADERHEAELRQKNEIIRQKDESFQEKDIQTNRMQADIGRLQAESQQREEQHTRAIQQLNAQLREKDDRLRQREEELQTQLRQKDEQRNADISTLQREIRRLQESLQQMSTQHSAVAKRPVIKTPLSELNLPLKLKWRRGKDLPFEMWGYPNVVLFKEKMYIGGRWALSDWERQIVMVYDPKQDSYDTLPPYAYERFSMAVINNQLVLVGGMDVLTDKLTNQLGVWNEQSKRWTHPLPPMITACRSSLVVTHNNRWLVVMGGHDGITCLSRVEILDTDSAQWYHAASLPQSLSHSLPAIIGNMCYLLGGDTTGGASSQKVFSVCLDDLISQAVSQSASASAPPTPSPWQSLPDTPLILSTALAFNGALLAVGGESYTAIYHYRPSSRSWVEAGELPAGRSRCTCTVLPSGDLYVAGAGRDAVLQVDLASVQVQ